MGRLAGKFGGEVVRTLLAGAAVAILLGGTAVALTSDEFRYSEPQTGRLTIHPMALVPESGSAANSYGMDYFGASLSGTGCYQTEIQLPQGARITKVRTYYVSDANSDLHVRMVRNHLGTDVSSELVWQTVANNSGTRTWIDHQLPTTGATAIDNTNYAYAYAACLGTGTVFEGVRITYTYRTAGD